ncbi:hypothetical protein Y887_02345 [Xanthomonas pisi DSM 18956]|nr:hypothetical protein Y887_02345 [Xanthomonas pisi DSM 18956]
MRFFTGHLAEIFADCLYEVSSNMFYQRVRCRCFWHLNIRRYDTSFHSSLQDLCYLEAILQAPVILQIMEEPLCGRDPLDDCPICIIQRCLRTHYVQHAIGVLLEQFFRKLCKSCADFVGEEKEVNQVFSVSPTCIGLVAKFWPTQQADVLRNQEVIDVGDRHRRTSIDNEVEARGKRGGRPQQVTRLPTVRQSNRLGDLRLVDIQDCFSRGPERRNHGLGDHAI